jgi:hypothetical protein
MARAKETNNRKATDVNPKPTTAGGKQATRKLDRVSRRLDGAVEDLRGKVEAVSECLYELLATAARRDCRKRFIALAEAGVLHDLHTLAVGLERLGPVELPPSLTGLSKYARLAVNQLCRTFEVQPVHQPGDSLTVAEHQRAAFDWSADVPGEYAFPVRVAVLRSGWKAAADVLVKPRVVRVGS